MTAVKYQTMPPLSPEQYAQLEQSILADGVQVPIIVDESGVIIDGHHRKAIADHHGLHCPREVRSMLTEDQKIELSVQLNIARRQLSKEEIVAQIARLRESGKSIRRISELTSVPKSTVSDAVRELSETGQLEQPETVRGNDGKDRPAVFKRTETTKEEFTEEVDGMTVDTRTGEIVDTPPAGLDGKEYKRPEPRGPKPVAEG
ncbi:ParB/RepB/Spo0J family partition protein, partial [Leucobacter albus]